MPKRKLNWALLSTARINDRIIPAIKKSKHANLYAVASRSNRNLKQYARKRKIPIFYSSYEELLKDKKVDVIYISLPNHLHSKWIMLATKAKKNVLCEKPITTSINEINKIINAAKKNRVAVQEATMMRFHSQTSFIKKVIKTGKIGNIKYMSAIFSISMGNYKDIRFKYKDGGGSLWDLGSYCISFARCVLQLIKPTSGSVFFDDVDLTKIKGNSLRKLRSKFQMVFQDPGEALNPRMKISEII